ncbi:dihydroxyacetone kinase subunit DhaL [Pseudarthrobacter sp. H3Y2-7]|jgi:dihydroxyacetone kinase/dihydroxyacetone kinase-like protein|uniref:dihydroxyacetone kinase subunit DhaL n=1 Tax=Pseudarthrobacter TaxID=1742993 RepID=UPI0023B00EF3|nr:MULTISPECIES: dihydroxyacetone kinase subunit DhaL [unclassified Pseudarthrobacter]MDE8670746.1 dihydroxyacetone kinase subunit DhaL [Pseudarthrobacter sp. H3Y2-7]
MTATDLADVEYVVRTLAQTAVDKEKEFGDLDAVVGDGDLGYSLARGFEKVLQDWDSLKRDDVPTFLQQIALAIASRIGGTSGPLWGTAFLRASAAAKTVDRIDGAAAVAMLRAAAEGIMTRGGASLGDKTLLDALVPATDELERQLAAGAGAAECRAAFAKTVRECADATSKLEAKRGRASYSGARSIGSPDAGATALAVIIERITEGWDQR